MSAKSNTFTLPPVSGLVIARPPGQVLAAELRDGQVWGLHWAWLDQPEHVGAVYRVRVTRLAPEAHGAFVAVDKAGTQGFLDLSATKNVPHEGAQLLAQVTRMPSDGKRLTFKPDARLAGRYLVYTPSKPGMAVSRQVQDKALGQHLQGLLRHATQPDEGAIVRAAAASLVESPEAILAELATHRIAWEQAKAHKELGEVLAAPSLIERLVIERPGVTPLTITVDSNQTLTLANAAIARWADLEPIGVHLSSSDPMAELGVDETFDQAVAAEVPLPDGGRLWIEQTRACCAIDIDSAGATGRAVELRPRLNRQAARELARQIRLRQVAGPVVVDFLRIADAERERQVLSDLRAAFAEDPATLRFNDKIDRQGLFSFSRQRLGPYLGERMADGGGRVALLDGMRAYLRQTLASPGQAYALALAPFTAKLVSQMPLAVQDLAVRLGQQPVVVSDPTLPANAFDIRPA